MEVIMPFVDQDVAAQLEGVWVLELVNYAETLKRLGLSPSAATESIGDGVCVYTSPDLPVNRAAGMGLHSPVTTGQMQEMESFFADRKMPAQFDLCPLASRSVRSPPMRPRYGHGQSLPVLRRPMDSTSRTLMSFLHAPPHTVQASSVTWLQSGDSLPAEEP